MSTTEKNHDKRNFMFLALCTILLGLSLIIWTEQAIRIICLVAGFVMLCWGLIEIIRYFAGDNRSVFRTGLVTGVLGAGFGLICVTHPDDIGNLLGILIGIALLVDALFKLQCGLNLMRFKFQYGWLVALLGGIALVLAVLIIALPQMILVLTGIMVLANGLMDIVTLIMLHMYEKHKFVHAEAAGASQAPDAGQEQA